MTLMLPTYKHQLFLENLRNYYWRYQFVSGFIQNRTPTHTPVLVSVAEPQMILFTIFIIKNELKGRNLTK